MGDHARNFEGQVALHLAAKENNVKELKRLLSLGADVNFSGKYGLTPLQVAAHYHRGDSHFETIELLLSNGANVNVSNCEGKTPLHISAENAKMKTLQLLLKFGADVNKMDSKGDTPMISAIRAKNLEAVQLLFDYYSEINNFKTKILLKALTALAGNSHVGVIEVLLKLGADVNARDYDGNTALHKLASRGDVEVIKLLLDYKADVNAKNNHGRIPLWEAIEGERGEIVKLLIDHGSDVKSVDNEGSTFLHNISIFYLKLETIKLLVKNGTNLNAIDSEGLTPLLNILRFDITALQLKFFLKHADVNCVDLEGNNILDKISQNSYDQRNLWEVPLEHFAKLQALELPIRPSILETISNSRKYYEYFAKCSEELELAKNTKLHNSWITFFNLLTDSKRKLRNYAGNQDLVEDLKNTECSKKFPIYGATIKKRMEKGMEIRELYDESTITMCDCLPIFNSDHLIIRDIKDYLQEEDYKELAWMFLLTKTVVIREEKEGERIVYY